MQIMAREKGGWFVLLGWSISRFDSIPFFFFLSFSPIKIAWELYIEREKKKEKKKKNRGERWKSPSPATRRLSQIWEIFLFHRQMVMKQSWRNSVHCDLVVRSFVQGGGGSRVRRNVAPSSSPKQFVCCQKPTWEDRRKGFWFACVNWIQDLKKYTHIHSLLKLRNK